MTKDLYFAGVNLRTEYGVKISGSGTFDSPVRGYESVQVPGRSGDILLPEKRLENVVITYPAFISEDFDANFAGLRAFLLSKIGYQRIEDGYHPDEYRLGYYQGALAPKTARNLKSGQFDLKFICKPQRYLTDGEQTETISEDGAIENPTGFDAMPLIKAYKATTANTGYLDIGDVSITIAWGTMSAVYIDCDSMDCYYLNGDAKVSANNKVSMNSLYFPVLAPGETGVTLGTGVSKIDVVPRTFTV